MRVDQLDFEAAEIHLRNTAFQIAARALEPHINAGTSGYTGPQRPCPCGQTAR